MVITVANQKGGTGKTTVSLNLACDLALQGKRVLLVDADDQGSALEHLAEPPEGVEMPDVIKGQRGRLEEQVAERVADYDHVFIDCPPKQAEVTRRALLACDMVLIPVKPTPTNVRALGDLLELLEDAKNYRPNIFVKVVLTQQVRRTNIGDEAILSMRHAGLDILESELVHRAVYQECEAAGCGVTVYAPREKAADEVRQLVKELGL